MKVAFSEDLMIGAAPIAEFLFGHPRKVRKIYYLSQHSRMPLFRIGSRLCARKSVLLVWIEQQENKCPGFIRVHDIVAKEDGQDSPAAIGSGSKTGSAQSSADVSAP
jgi:hypothetical protein